MEYTNAPENFETRIQVILEKVELIIPKLEEEWKFTLEEFKTRFGLEAIKVVLRGLKSVPQDFLKKKLQISNEHMRHKGQRKILRKPQP